MKKQRRELLKLEVAYKKKYASNLEEDIAKYAEDRNKEVQERFIKEGIMERKHGSNGYDVYWNSKNDLGKRSMIFFLKLVSGLPLRYMLYREIFDA